MGLKYSHFLSNKYFLPKEIPKLYPNFVDSLTFSLYLHDKKKLS